MNFEKTTTQNFPKRIIFYHLPLFIIAIFLFAACKKTDNLAEIAMGADNSTNAQKRMNVIVIFGDDVGMEVPEYFGGQSYSTPRINQMAAEGAQLNQTFTSPLCSPSRVMLLTGKYSFRNYGLWGKLDTSNRTIANMLKDAGYKTLVAGKWQLDGGDAAIRKFGFDDYMVYTPFQDGGYGKGSRFKDPTLYWKGALLPKDSMKGKYGDDVLVDYISNFIDSNKRKPFFIYFPIMLCHWPYCPTPDDPDFATWNNQTSEPDVRYFAGMVNYMDKKIGQVMDKVKDAGIADRTVIIYLNDNGSGIRVHSQYKGKDIQGGKGNPWMTGTKQPMIVWSPGNVRRQVNNSLVDLTDFLPTIADITKTPLPTTWGPLDGVSFYPSLRGVTGLERSWVFCHFDKNEGGPNTNPIQRWINSDTYKLFDSTGLFYNVKKDPMEEKPIPDNKLTASEQQIKADFQQVLGTMHN